MQVHLRARAVLRLLALCLLASSSAYAQPYEVLAVYEPATNTGTSKTLRVELSANALLPDGGESHTLDRIVVRFEPDGVSLSAISIFSRLKFTVDVGGQLTTTEIRTEDIGKLPNRELTLMRWRGDDKPDAVVAVSVSLQASYAGDFLCLQERALLQHQLRQNDDETPERIGSERVPILPGQPEKAGTQQGTESKGKAATSPKNDDGDAQSGTELRTVALTQGRVPIIYTFCKTTDSGNNTTRIDWKRALGDANGKFMLGSPEQVTSADQLREAHKRELSKLIVEQLNDRFSSFGRTVATSTDKPDYDNVLIQVASTLKFFVVKSAGSLVLVEESGGDVHRLADLIDQDAEVALALDRPVCLQLPPAALMNSPWTFELEVPDGKEGKTRKAKIDMDFRHGCNRMLLVQWKDYLNQRVTFRIIYRVPGNEDIVVFKDSFHIYNLGLITTVPVLTEIVSAAQKSSPADIEATSSIPVSIAIPLNDREQRSGSVAVTFPFTVSVNTRQFPNLAEYIAVAPSISFIGGGYTSQKELEGGETTSSDQGPNVRVAIGVGVNVARAFHFGYAWTPADGGRYTLIGISIPDLLHLFSKGQR